MAEEEEFEGPLGIWRYPLLNLLLARVGLIKAKAEWYRKPEVTTTEITRVETGWKIVEKRE